MSGGAHVAQQRLPATLAFLVGCGQEARHLRLFTAVLAGDLHDGSTSSADGTGPPIVACAGPRSSKRRGRYLTRALRRVTPIPHLPYLPFHSGVRIPWTRL